MADFSYLQSEIVMYNIIKNLLFTLPPEQAHRIALQSINILYKTGLIRFIANTQTAPRTLMGLNFPNPIGLAAGLDVNAHYVDALFALGFGFVEVGAVTPKPQKGNPAPRLFRLPDQRAIINRMGFHNNGVEQMVQRLEKRQSKGILGINIGKNRDTSLDNAIDDYLFCFRHLWQFADYITINISSPNTPGLRNLQQRDFLEPLLANLKKMQKSIAEKKYVPLVVKVSPDLSTDELHEVATILLEQQIDGVAATNTTVQREGIENSAFAKEVGGLSGKPLCTRSTEVIRQLHSILQNKIPIIGLGGIMDEASAKEKIAAGAQLLQIYTGFIYEGPGLITRLVDTMQR